MAGIAVSDALVMRMSIQESISWIKERYNIQLGYSTFKKYIKVDDNVNKRLFELAKEGYLIKHDEKIKSSSLIRHELWKQYWKAEKENNITKIRKILSELRVIQPYYLCIL